jgi:hypothetical protein
MGVKEHCRLISTLHNQAIVNKLHDIIVNIRMLCIVNGSYQRKESVLDEVELVAWNKKPQNTLLELRTKSKSYSSP